jgi:hypothetical protein
MLRIFVEKIVTGVAAKIWDSRTAIGIEVLTYMTIFRWLTKMELDACIDNYSETIDHFKGQMNTHLGESDYTDYYGPVVESLEKMLVIFKQERASRK